jgi:hypothetical protein
MSTIGEVHSSSPTLGEWSVRPDQCASGDRDDFWGVTLDSRDRKDFHLVVAAPPGKPPTASITMQGARFDLGPADCERLVVTIEDTDEELDGNTIFSGAVEIDCALGSGGSVTADLTFENCQ